MGLQDRDYYWEKYHNQKPPKKGGGSLKYLIIPAIMLASLWYGADAFLKYQATGKTPAIAPGLSSPTPTPSAATPAKKHGVNPISGGIVLKTDRQGHFRGTALINGIPMPFLIDTGATKTVIPKKIATSAGLPFGRPIQTNTAGGKIYDRETRINSLRIGNAVIRNLDAHINDHIDHALIGMNTLKYFRMTQSGDTLTLVANNQVSNKNAAPSAVRFDSIPAQQPLIRKPVTIKKTVTCDKYNNCKTTYSDR